MPLRNEGFIETPNEQPLEQGDVDANSHTKSDLIDGQEHEVIDRITSTSTIQNSDNKQEGPTEERDSASLKTTIWRMWVRFCCIESDDDFVQVLRKSSAALLFLMGFAPILFGTFFVFQWFQGAEEFQTDMGSQILTLTLLLWGCWDFFPYLWIRFNTKHMSTALEDVNVAGLTFFATMTTLVWPDSVINVACIAAALLAVLTQTRYVTVHCALLGLVFCLDCYNKAFRHTEYELLIRGARSSSSIEMTIAGFGGGSVVALGILGVSAQSIAHIKHVSVAKAAVNVCHQIVNLLRRYDTEGVTKALAEHKDVDPELISSLKLINNNLESYRPFLPNYLFLDANDTNEEEGDGLVGENRRFSFSDDEGSLHSFSYRSSASGTMGTADPTSLVNSDSQRLPSSGAQQLQSSGKVVVAAHKSVFEGSISFALVEIPTELRSRRDIPVVSQLVESIYAAADVSKASVHTLTGSVAIVSWNATHRLAQPEMKATRFLNHLKTQDRSGTAFGAVVFSGPASCYSVTTSGKQHASVITAPWMPMATEAFALACRHKVMLIDERTESVSSSYFQSIFVDRVALCDTFDPVDTKTTFEGAVLLASLLSETYEQRRNEEGTEVNMTQFKRIASLFQLVREVDLSNQEWMYQLEMKEQSETQSKRLEEAALKVFDLAMASTSTSNTDVKNVCSQLQAAATAVCSVIHQLNETILHSVSDKNVLFVECGDSDSLVCQAAAAIGQCSMMHRLERHIKSISLP